MINFLLSAKRDISATKRFFRKALAQPHTMNSHTITVDSCVISVRDAELGQLAGPEVAIFSHDITQVARMADRAVFLGASRPPYWRRSRWTRPRVMTQLR